MASIFTKIIQGEIPSYKVAEDALHYAFLDINPNNLGHTLCVPKLEVDKIFDLDKEAYLKLMGFSYKVSKAIENVIPCERVGMTVIGLEVPHAHVHLIPLNSMDDARFIKKATLTKEEFIYTAEKIAVAFNS